MNRSGAALPFAALLVFAFVLFVLPTNAARPPGVTTGSRAGSTDPLPPNPAPVLFLPMIQAPSCTGGICGHVTLDSAAVSGVSLKLWFYNGSNWSNLSTTTTDANGAYAFSAASLTPGQGYYVSYLNTTTSDRLSSWTTRTLSAYQAGMNVPIGDFDIADVALGLPNHLAKEYLPVTFHWDARPASPSDSYVFYLAKTNYSTQWWTPQLGYASSFTVDAPLPAGFTTGVYYAWYIGVFSPNGGRGSSLYGPWVCFQPGCPTLTAPEKQGIPFRFGPGSN